jgi:glycosyltransferase involved in cell wall biosynthesis
MENNKKIRVLAIPGDTYGCGSHRTLWPHQKLDELYGDEFDVTIDYNPDFSNYTFFEKFDIIHAHRMLGPHQNMPNLVQFLKIKGIKLILDIDDYWDVGRYHPAYAKHKQLGLSQVIQNSLKQADYVTTTTQIFADKIKKVNPNVKVFPNAIDPTDDRFVPVKTLSKRLRVGMVMGSSHLNDVENLRGMVNSLPKEILDQMQIVLCGFDTRGTIETINQQTGQIVSRPIEPKETVWYTYEQIMTDNYKIVSPEYKEFLHKFIPDSEWPNIENEPYRRCWTKHINSYMSHYQHVDILLVPIKETEFTEVKSNLKFVEAGATNTAVIATNFGPYTIDSINAIEKGGIINPEGNVILVDSRKNHKDWLKYVVKLVKDRELLQQLQTNLNKMVLEKYDLRKITKERAEFYKTIIN